MNKGKVKIENKMQKLAKAEKRYKHILLPRTRTKLQPLHFTNQALADIWTSQYTGDTESQTGR